jgi:hypothetical protein
MKCDQLSFSGKTGGRAGLTLGDPRQLVLQPLEVDESDKERRRLDVGVLDEEGDERLETRETRLGSGGSLIGGLLLSGGRRGRGGVGDTVGRRLGRRRRRGRERGRRLVDDDDGAGFGSDVD